MNVTESKVFTFNFQAQGIGYNFAIPANSLSDACTKLRDSLTEIGTLLDTEMLKQQTAARGAH